MTEIVLLLVIAVQLGFIYLQNLQFKEERNRLINAIVAKTPEDLINLNVVDKMKHEDVLEPVNQDMVPVEGLSDEEFSKYAVRGEENG